MSREEYMKALQHKLSRLPKEDYNRAIDYFVEYFEEAGAENEQVAIEDLGTPEAAATQIVQDIARVNAQEETKSVKRGISKVWVGVLAVFAAPIALPLAAGFALVLLGLLLMVFGLLFALVITIAALVVSAIPCFIGSIWLLFTSPMNGLASLGVSLIGFSIGIWIVRGCITLAKRLLSSTNRLTQKMIRKGKEYAK